jgi:hypothetical protein
MALYKGANEGGALGALRQAQRSAVGRMLGNTVSTINGIWAAGLLFNPLNAVKAHLEDIIKFRAAGGSAAHATHALVSPVIDAGRRVLRQPTHGGSTGQFVRQHLAGLADRKGVWETVATGKPGHFQAAKRWLEGSALNDDALRFWARAHDAGDPSIFHRWFDEVGQFQRKATTFPIPGTNGRMRTLDAYAAYDMIGGLVDTLATASKDPAAFRRLLVEAATSGQREVPNKLARIMGPVPIERTTPRRGVLGAGFDLLYGAPARARGAVLYDHYYDTAMGIYEQRFGGRIVDDMLDNIVSAGFAQSRAEAEWLLTVRSRHLDEWIHASGFVTRARLEREAHKWAARHAQSLMYLGGASTIAGKAFAKAAPFAPAQFDFLRFWFNQMMSGTDIALNRPTAAVVGALGRAAGGADTAVGRGLTRAAEGAIHTPLPFNARLAARWSHLAAESDRSAPGDWEQRGAGHPIELISRFTFLPVDFSDPDNFLVDFAPGLGPIPSWAIHMLPEDSEIRQMLESALPSLGWITGQSDLTPESMARYLLPTTTRSLTGVIGWMGRGVAASGDNMFADKAEELMASQIASGLFDWQRRPIGFTDAYKHRIGEALAANPDVVPGTAEFDALVVEVMQAALDEANSGEFSQRLRSYAGIQSRFGSDATSIQHYAGMMAMLPDLRAEIGDAQADQLAGWWEQIETGTASEQTKRLFADVAATTLFSLEHATRDMLIARHPGLAVNMVGTVQCSVDRGGNFNAPEGYCRPDGRIDTSNPALQGSNGARVRQQGFEEGWFEPRPEAEIFEDVVYALSSSRRNHLRNLWEAMTGRPYADGMVAAIRDASFTFPDDSIVLEEFAHAGLDLPPGTYTGEELRDWFRGALASAPQREIRVSDLPILQEMARSPEYDTLRAAIRQLEGLLADLDDPITSMWDWPDDVKAAVRDEFALAATTDPNLLTDYNRWLRPALGPLDWTPPTPPPVEGLENAFRASPSDVVVEDGDTFRVLTRDGDIRVRIIGINAPEQGQEGYAEAAEQLERLLAAATDIVIGQYEPEKFGAVQQVDENAVRLFAWLYVDGVPIYDPAAFTATNQRGVETGGKVTDLAALMAANRKE